MLVDMTHNRTIFSGSINAAAIFNQVISDFRQAKKKSSTYVSNINETKIDDRNIYRGCAMRQNWSSWKKVGFLNEIIQAIKEGLLANITEYYHDILKNVSEEVEGLRNLMSKWSKPDAYGKCFDDLLGQTKSSNVKKIQKRNTASPFHDIEAKLYYQFVEKRKKVHKVSSQWLRVNALKY